MILLIDADSLVYSCSYGCETKEDALHKFDEHIQFIVNEVSEFYPVSQIVTYHGSSNNFRNDITKTYKANRKHNNKPEYYHELSEYVTSVYNAISATGEEVDDVVARDWLGLNDGGHDVCIVSIDKDYLQLPALIYNYNQHRRGFTQVTPEQARRNFWTQMITGDAADNVNYLKGKGKVYAKRLLNDATNSYSHMRRVYSLFVEEYGNDAKEKFNECYKLLKIG
jgi:5'-3' exonuclease